MPDSKSKTVTVFEINKLQLSANLIIDVDSAVKAVDVLKTVDSLQNLIQQWD